MHYNDYLDNFLYLIYATNQSGDRYGLGLSLHLHEVYLACHVVWQGTVATIVMYDLQGGENHMAGFGTG